MLHSKKSNKLFMIQLLFFRQVFLLISHKAGKAKWIEKRSGPVKQVFQQYKITNCTHVVYIFALFELYLEQLNDKPNYLVVPLTEAASQFPQILKPTYSNVVNYNACLCARPKATKIYLILGVEISKKLSILCIHIP